MTALAAALAVVVFTSGVLAEPLQSPRLVRAKDLIADEQWDRAVEQLKAAAADPKERHKDEALFWLAHSQHQSRDSAAALETIAVLERQHAKSPWLTPARSLKIEIAQKLNRNDVLWMTVRPPSQEGASAAPAPPAAPVRTPSPGSKPVAARPQAPPPLIEDATIVTPAPAPPAEAIRRAPPSGQRTSRTAVTTTASVPSAIWFGEGWDPDMNLRIQALGSLLQTDAPRVIPILRDIALDSPNPNEASRAVFLLAQSGRPEAYATVLEVARRGNESVQIAAVKELGRFGGAKLAEELLQVYAAANPRVKYQVVHSLGERSATAALMQIAEKESDRRLQETAIVRLGQAGGREQLQRFYARARPEQKRPIIIGLFNARAEDELIRIAEQEKDQSIRAEALTRLRLLGTAKARAYLEKQAQVR